MTPGSRPATHDDIPELERLYRALAEEQAALRPLWPWADGLDVPIADSFASVLIDQGDVQQDHSLFFALSREIGTSHHHPDQQWQHEHHGQRTPLPEHELDLFPGNR